MHFLPFQTKTPLEEVKRQLLLRYGPPRPASPPASSSSSASSDTPGNAASEDVVGHGDEDPGGGGSASLSSEVRVICVQFIGHIYNKDVRGGVRGGAVAAV